MAFFFKWVANGNTAFGPAMQVEDEEVYSFDLQHTEGDFASLKIAVINPRVGLLNDGRPRWAWVSYKDQANAVHPLFHGRLIGFPADMSQTIVTLEFIGRPANFETQKKALALALKVAPFYDPIFVDETRREDPDVAWEARAELWHVGRTDKLVTSSNIITGEDGLIELTGADIAAGSLAMQTSKPIQKVHVDATVSWRQRSVGTLDLSKKLIAAFVGKGAPPLSIASYTGQGLEDSWPRHNDNIGGGWSVYQTQANLRNTSIGSSSYLKVKINPALATPDFEIEDWWATSTEGYDYWYKKAYDAWLAAKITETPPEARFYLWVFQPTFVVSYEAERDYAEVLSFDLEADMQELITTDDEPPTVETISVQSQSISEKIDGELPIGNLNRNSYFKLDRAKQSIEYLMMLARAKILFGARAVSLSFQVPFETGLQFSCRKDIQLSIDELPGGVARGKITAYSLTLAVGGKLSSSVTIGCTVGRGGASDDAAPGDPVYAAPGYMNDYQRVRGGINSPVIGELTYKDFKIKVLDDGLRLDNLSADNAIGDVAATALLTFGPNPVDGKVIHIGPRVYTFKNVLAAVNQIKIGPTPEDTADNTSDAINATEEFAGISFFAGTVQNEQVQAEAQDGIVRITARVPGVAGNAIAVSADDLGTVWDHPTLTLGSFGLVIVNPPTVQAAQLAGEFGQVQDAIDKLNDFYTRIELTMKPLGGGPFSTPIVIDVSKLKVPKTIDLEAD